MASGFVTSAGKQWAGQYDCGNSQDYGKSAGKGTKGKMSEERSEGEYDKGGDSAAKERSEGE